MQIRAVCSMRRTAAPFMPMKSSISSTAKDRWQKSETPWRGDSGPFRWRSPGITCRHAKRRKSALSSETAQAASRGTNGLLGCRWRWSGLAALHALRIDHRAIELDDDGIDVVDAIVNFHGLLRPQHERRF